MTTTFRVVAIFVVITLLSSCGGTQKSESASTPPQIPVFSGAYKTDYADVASKYADNSFVLSIISDEKITTEEMNESYSRYDSCMVDNGFKVVFNTPGDYTGRFSIQPSSENSTDEDMNNAEQSCNKLSAFRELLILEDNERTNPNNEDMYKIMAACLVRHGLVPSDYTTDDYKRDFENFDYGKNNDNNILSKYLSAAPYSQEQSTFDACQNNPLDLDN